MPKSREVDEPAPRVAAVVVTFNRRELLVGCLRALDAQTRRPDSIIVVDNASSDGTAELVTQAFPDAVLVRLTRNTGGAGGFAAGIAAALADGADLIWLMDDDTEPRVTALDSLVEAWRDYPGQARPAFVAGRVVWTDGRDHPMNTPRRRPVASKAELGGAATVACIPIRSASFVSVLLDANAVRHEALPVADFFLWSDDFEYTARLARRGVGLLCRDSVALHRTARFGSTDVDPGERFYYEVRNKIWTLTRSNALGPAERIGYGYATTRRWLRTVRRSHDRQTLSMAFRRGLTDAVRRPPRDTLAILEDAGFSASGAR